MDGTEINRHFLIKVNGYDYIPPALNKVLKYNGLVELIGQQLADKLCDRAMNSLVDVPVSKLRRGLTIRFYPKYDWRHLHQ